MSDLVYTVQATGIQRWGHLPLSFVVRIKWTRGQQSFKDGKSMCFGMACSSSGLSDLSKIGIITKHGT